LHYNASIVIHINKHSCILTVTCPQQKSTEFPRSIQVKLHLWLEASLLLPTQVKNTEQTTS